MATKQIRKKGQVGVTHVVDAYWDHLLEHGEAPVSVFKFCRDHGINEAEFYKEYGSFETIEARFWESTVRETIAILDADEEAAHYTASQLLLAFYFTYFEQALAHRSRFLLKFPKLSPRPNSELKGFNAAFKEFSQRILGKAKEEGIIQSLGKINELQEKALLPQFRYLIDFNLKDCSQNFEDTDALIEKSVRFFFDAVNFPLIESTIDLVRFLFPRISKR